MKLDHCSSQPQETSKRITKKEKEKRERCTVLPVLTPVLGTKLSCCNVLEVEEEINIPISPSSGSWCAPCLVYLLPNKHLFVTLLEYKKKKEERCIFPFFLLYERNNSSTITNKGSIFSLPHE
jgi:hypothetical protein